jgi:hypothetical protein
MTIQNTETLEGITFYRVSNDVNGNPRYVFHFLALAESYDKARRLGKKLGASVYRGKWFGGGLVIQSYNLLQDAKDINEMRELNCYEKQWNELQSKSLASA